ncbi:hypothetical protein LIER_14689 [Lithospermum erythrorhizon]|uniref:Uncharacterized protein n=1 Tax=Lithospermum erythrorhizon TaxID=34254 RepID=A0AAV3Q118_LITER
MFGLFRSGSRSSVFSYKSTTRQIYDPVYINARASNVPANATPPIAALLTPLSDGVVGVWLPGPGAGASAFPSGVGAGEGESSVTGEGDGVGDEVVGAGVGDGVVGGEEGGGVGGAKTGG